jgi:hypothetical protein
MLLIPCAYPAKRKRALLGSNPPRNSRWKLSAMGRHRQDAGLTVWRRSLSHRTRFPHALKIQCSAHNDCVASGGPFVKKRSCSHDAFLFGSG